MAVEKANYITAIGSLMLEISIFAGSKEELQIILTKELFFKDSLDQWQINIGKIKTFSIEKVNQLIMKLKEHQLINNVCLN